MKRFTKNYIFYNIFCSIFYIVLLFFIFLFSIITNESTDGNIQGIIVVIVYGIIGMLVIIVRAILYVNTSGYELREKEIYCKRGIIFKKNSILEYKRIHAINKKQNMFQRMFNVAVLTIDSGSTNTAESAEIIIYETDEVVNKILEEIKIKQCSEISSNDDCEEKSVSNEEMKEIYTFTSKSKLIYSFLNCIFSIISITILGAIFWIIVTVTIPYIKFEGINGKDFIENAIYISIYMFFGSLIFIFIVSICTLFIKYHDFKICKKDHELQISYGLFVKSDNRFQERKIKAVRVNQSLVQRIFKFATINLEVVGYCEGNDNSNNSGKYTSIGVLVPFCKISQVNAILEKILPNFIVEKRVHKAKAYLPFVKWPSLIAFLLIMIPSIISSMCYLVIDLKEISLLIIVLAFLITLITIGYIMIKGIFSYQCHGITITNKKVIIYRGSISKECVVIQNKDLIAIEDITTVYRRKKGIYSYKVHFFTNSKRNVVYLKNVDEILSEQLRDILTY